MTQLYPIINQPFLYAYGLTLRVASTTTLTITSGQCRDSNNILDMSLTSNTTLNSAVTGANGLDTGTFAAATWYYIFVIADSSGSNATATLMSLSQTAPTLPAGYDSLRYIGQARTAAGGATFLTFYQTGTGASRQLMWDTGVQVLTTGSATTATAVTLTTGVPPIDYTPVMLMVDFTANVATDVVTIKPFGSTGVDTPHVSCDVAAVLISGQLELFSRVDSGAPKVLYINSAAGCATSMWVVGFRFSI